MILFLCPLLFYMDQIPSTAMLPSRHTQSGNLRGFLCHSVKFLIIFYANVAFLTAFPYFLVKRQLQEC